MTRYSIKLTAAAVATPGFDLVSHGDFLATSFDGEFVAAYHPNEVVIRVPESRTPDLEIYLDRAEVESHS